MKITNIVPELPHSLPSTLNFEEYENFRDLPYPTIDRNRCGMLIGTDNVHLLEAMDEPSAHHVSC